MACKIEYDPKVFKQLKKLDREAVQRILKGIGEYAENPSSKPVKKLKTPFDGAYRLRIGDYRVVFYREGELMLISRIAHRKQVYL